MQIVRYAQSDHVSYHYDWDIPFDGNKRETSFFVYLEANCTGGGTSFAKLKPRPEPEWCEFVDCGRADGGVTFKPIVGNAIFWDNLHSTGAGREDTLHAGLAVSSGNKSGLNIWTWQHDILLDPEDTS
jgi:prolyl 4-hydroxylase